MTEEQADYAGQQIIQELRSRRISFYNRNKFYFRTDDSQATLIREYCAKHKISLTDFFKQLLTNHFKHV
tara:strand:- start:76 stop:282 length:207 start_codon:yes stop_codon:yes gene_type:complete